MEIGRIRNKWYPFSIILGWKYQSPNFLHFPVSINGKYLHKMDSFRDHNWDKASSSVTIDLVLGASIQNFNFWRTLSPRWLIIQLGKDFQRRCGYCLYCAVYAPIRPWNDVSMNQWYYWRFHCNDIILCLRFDFFLIQPFSHYVWYHSV